MDSSASNHMYGIASLFSSYDIHKHTSQKISIGDDKQLSVVGSSNVKVLNGTLEDVFHVHSISINFFSIYCVRQKGYTFEAWIDKYVLKDIKHNFKVVYFGLVDHDYSLYTFTSFHSTKTQSFYSYVAHVDEKSKLWNEVLYHLNYGKMKMLS